MKMIFVFILWTLICYSMGVVSGKNSTQNTENKKNVALYMKREEHTTQQEKTAEKIKIKYLRFRSKDEECNFVLDYNVDKCLHN